MADTTDKEAGNVGQDLYVQLSEDADFLLPDINLGDADFQFPDPNDNPLYKDIVSLSNEDLTTRVVGGEGTFDALMASVGAHLKVEFEKNRITGKDYTDAYVQVMANALGTATQYLLGKDQAYWQALLVQQQARRAEIETVTARIGLETAKAALAAARYQAYNAKAEYALTKMQIANADAQFDLTNQQTENAKVDHDIRTYTLATDMPIATDIAKLNLASAAVDKDIKTYNLNSTLPAQLSQIKAQTTLLGSQNANVLVDSQTKSYSLSNILPQQKNLLVEQTESARSDTLTSRLSDGALITGTKGKQRDLYEQQITSYERDAEAKVARIFADMWITRKTLDEGLTPPPSMADANYDSVLNGLRQKVGF